MKLAHARDNRLTCVLIVFYLKGGVFGFKLGKGLTDLFLITVRLWLHGHGNHGLVSLDWFKDYRIREITQGVARAGCLQSYDTNDVSCSRLTYSLPFVGMHGKDSGQLFFCFFCRVEDFLTSRQPA